METTQPLGQPTLLLGCSHGDKEFFLKKTTQRAFAKTHRVIAVVILFQNTFKKAVSSSFYFIMKMNT